MKEWNSFSFISKIKKEGLADEIGFSYHGDAGTLECILNEHPEVDFVQLQLNYMDWNSAVVQSMACWNTAVRHQKKIHVMEPLKGGMLTQTDIGKEEQCVLANLGLRFVAQKQNVRIVLSGMNEPNQIRENLMSVRGGKPLDERELQTLEAIRNRYESQRIIACSKCNYCMDQCPKQIPIPRLFEVYNALMLTGDTILVNSRIYLKNLCVSDNKPSKCLSCGRCERACPQQLPIRQLLKAIAEKLE